MYTGDYKMVSLSKIDKTVATYIRPQTYPISPGYLQLNYKMPPFYEELRKVLIESSKK